MAARYHRKHLEFNRTFYVAVFFKDEGAIFDVKSFRHSRGLNKAEFCVSEPGFKKFKTQRKQRKTARVCKFQCTWM